MIKFSYKMKKNIIISVLVFTVTALGIGLVSYISKGENKNDIEIKKVDVKVITDNIEIDNMASEISKDEDIEEVIIETDFENESENANEEVIIETKKQDPPQEKPKTNEDITDKNIVPTYDENQVKTQEEASPQGGEINEQGQVYMLGFGWIEDSGPNSGQVVTADGDVNKQVGTMD